MPKYKPPHHLLPKPRAPRYPPSKPPSPQITYNLKLLLHDLLNLKTSPAAAARLDRTTDPLYISTPYFTDEEAEIVKGSLVEMAFNLPEGDENGDGVYEGDHAEAGSGDEGGASEDDSAASEGHEGVVGRDRALDRALDRGTSTDRENVLATTGAVQKAPTTPATVSAALTTHLAPFLSKRTASGDFRPCGPHDMLPVYMAVFSVSKAELEDETFVSRVRREGVGSMSTKALRDPLRDPLRAPLRDPLQGKKGDGGGSGGKEKQGKGKDQGEGKGKRR
jgi:hypothetical protein